MQRKSYEYRKKEYEQRFEAKTPVEFLKYHGHIISEADLKMLKELHKIGLKSGVINVLLEYVLVVSRDRILHPLVIELARYWFSQSITSVEHATEYVTEELKKYVKGLENNRQSPDA